MEIAPTANLTNYLEALTKAKEALKLVTKEDFRQVFQGFFEKHPEIEAASFCCYTPSFNDGDPCTFTVSGCQVKPAGLTEDQIEETNRSDGFVDYYEFDDLVAEHLQEALKQDMKGLEEFLESSELLIEKLFGDGTRVILTREGVETESYDGGY